MTLGSEGSLERVREVTHVSFTLSTRFYMILYTSTYYSRWDRFCLQGLHCCNGSAFKWSPASSLQSAGRFSTHHPYSNVFVQPSTLSDLRTPHGRLSIPSTASHHFRRHSCCGMPLTSLSHYRGQGAIDKNITLISPEYHSSHWLGSPTNRS